MEASVDDIDMVSEMAWTAWFLCDNDPWCVFLLLLVFMRQ